MNQKPTTSNTLRLMLVDDHAVVRAGYRRLLEDEADFQVVAEHGNAESAYAALGTQNMLEVDVLVLDLSMPGRSGLDVMRRLAMRSTTLRCLVFSMHDSPAMVAQALRAGASGFVTKSSEPKELVQAIRRVGEGHSQVLSSDIAHVLQDLKAEAPHVALTTREFDVLQCLINGRSLEQIAQALHISPKTVSNVQTQIRQRLGLSNAVDLLHYAREHRLLVP